MSAELVRTLVTDRLRFRPEWLDDGPKTVVPFPAPAHVDHTLADRLARGARAAGVGVLKAARAGGGAAEVPAVASHLADFPWHQDDFLLCLADLSGAALITTHGYALLAGSGEFLHAAVYEGVDEARAKFGQYARKLAQREPDLAAVAAEFPPRFRSWASPGEVSPGTGVAEQIELMERLARGELAGPDFEQALLAARRRSLNEGERMRRPLAEALDQVFYALEDYVADSELREPGELSDEELVQQVRSALDRLRALDRS